MHKFSQFITESTGNKNLQINHVEDEIISRGVAGGKDSLHFLQSLADMLAGNSDSKINVSVKYDGYPSLFCGINPENNQFFVSTKDVFLQNSVLSYTDADIDENYTDKALRKKLKIALRYLPKLNITNVLQGDVLFTKGDIQKETIDSESYVTFQPKTLTYAVPAESKLASKMTAAHIGIVFHTSYTGKTLQDMKPSYNIDIKNLTVTKDVWFRDAYFIDASGTATFTQKETADISDKLNTARTLLKSIKPYFLNRLATTLLIKKHIKEFSDTNGRVKDTARYVRELIVSIEKELNKTIIDAKRQETKRKRIAEKNEILRFLRLNAQDIKKLFDFMNTVDEIKELIIDKLQQIKQITDAFVKTEDGFRVTTPEGFIAIDKLQGNVVKLVDRMKFEQEKFNAAKNWMK